MDSATDGAVAEFRAMGVPVERVEDQDTTDLHKCLDYVHRTAGPSSRVLVIGALGGRLDHEMAAISTAMEWSGRFAALLLAGTTGCARVLPRGVSLLQVEPLLDARGCALMPVGEAPDRLLRPLTACEKKRRGAGTVRSDGGPQVEPGRR
jgi:thiamine pyrophosphokinase